MEIHCFHIWLKSFETFIEANTTSPAERLFFLSKYTAGEAKRAIQGFLMLDGPQVYQNAKSVVIKRFGDKYKLAELFNSEYKNNNNNIYL